MVRLFAFIYFYVYVIQNELDGSFYKEFSTNPILRLQSHNNGEATYTRYKCPWKLVYLEKIAEKASALKRERSLKKYSHQQMEQLILSGKNIICSFLNKTSE